MRLFHILVFRQFQPIPLDKESAEKSSCQNCCSECHTCSGPASSQCTSCIHDLALTPGDGESFRVNNSEYLKLFITEKWQVFIP